MKMLPPSSKVKEYLKHSIPSKAAGSIPRPTSASAALTGMLLNNFVNRISIFNGSMNLGCYVIQLSQIHIKHWFFASRNILVHYFLRHGAISCAFKVGLKSDDFILPFWLVEKIDHPGWIIFFILWYSKNVVHVLTLMIFNVTKNCIFILLF